jgi:hypothetical protein
MKFGQHQKHEFKKSFKLYHQILLRVFFTKVFLNFVHFAQTKISIMILYNLVFLHFCFYTI